MSPSKEHRKSLISILFALSIATAAVGKSHGQSDTSVADSESCKVIGRSVVVAEFGSESVEYYQYKCFEKDPIWGAVTLAFMFIPGLWAGQIWAGLGKEANPFFSALLWILTPPFFPMIVIGTKLLGLR